jgi:hypothetical protein
MAGLTNIQGNFKQRYGRWIDPLPDEHTLAEAGDFIPGENRPGLGYNFPVLVGIEHGQTADNTGNAFTLNPAVDSKVLNANLDGSTILVQSVVSYDVIYKSLNGTGNGNSGGAFKTALDQAVEAMLMGAGLYRELALAYGPGSGTTAAANIGVVSVIAAGANFGAHQTVTLTTKSFIPGLWIIAQNMRVDVLNAAGTTEIDTAVTVEFIVPNSTTISLFKTSSVATAVVGSQIVPTGWRTKSAYGLEAIYVNNTTLFGIDASTISPWKCLTFSKASTALTRADVMKYGAKVSLNGCKRGGNLYVSAPTFAMLAEEFNAATVASTGVAVTTYNGNENQRNKEIGTETITYITAAGPIKIVVYQYGKQGQAMFVASDNFRRVGSTDLTMRPIGGGAEAFFTHLTAQSGAQMKIFSNQAPVFEMPYRNFMIQNITNTGYDQVDNTGS